MPWRWGWPPWESERIRADRRQALENLERATVDLDETRKKAQRTARVADALDRAHMRNHFSESMEQLFAQRTTPHPKG